MICLLEEDSRWDWCQTYIKKKSNCRPSY